MWELITVYVSENFDKVFFSIITLIVLICAIIDFRDKNYPPGPMGLPFFGYLPLLNSEAPYLTFNELVQQYGRVFSVRFGSIYTVVVADINLIKEALSSEIFSSRPPLINASNGTLRIFGQTTTESEKWKDHQRFASSVLQFLGAPNSNEEKPVMEMRVEQGVKNLVKDLQTNGKPVDIPDTLSHNVGATLASIVLGTRFDKNSADWKILRRTYDAGRQLSSVTRTVNYVPWFRRFVQNDALVTFQDDLNESRQIYEDLMTKQARSVHVNNIFSVLDAYIIELKRRAGNDLGTFTNEEVYHVLSDLIGVGWESSMTTLQWLFLYMAIYSDVQDKIASEILELNRKSGEIKLEDMNVLTYTEATILETWRHASVLPLGIPHETLKDTTLGEFRIPKGSLIVPLFWSANHDSRLWENPDVFSPERFLNEDKSLRRNGNLIHVGKSMCIGEDMSYSLVRIFFANVMNNFSVHLAKGVTFNPDGLPECGMTLVPKNCNVVFEARH